MDIRFYLEGYFILAVEVLDFSLKNIYGIRFGLSDGDQIWFSYMDGDEKKDAKLLYRGALELIGSHKPLFSFASADKVVMENKKEILVFEKNKPREYKRKSLLYDLSFGIRGVKL